MAWGLYVHVPWCRVRCPYCAFHVDPDRGDLPAERFVERVLASVATLRGPFPGEPDTLYVGGGTPSRLPAAHLTALITALRGEETREVTCEANPEDVDDAWLHAMTQAGVSRISLGVQTLNPAHARRLGRSHTPTAARRAASWVASAVDTWSADLMFGLPDQTFEELAADVDAILALEPPHVSLYGLTFEEGTAFGRASARGQLQGADDELWRAMYAHIVHTLEAAGLARYEVSNFARPGHRSLHNSGYWAPRPYLGVGPSAHGLTPDGRRWIERADTAAWLSTDPPAPSWETLSEDEAAADEVISAMRSVEGVDLARLATVRGRVPDPAALRRLVTGGLLIVEEGRMRLAPDGFFVADAVTAAVVDALRTVAPSGHPR